MKHYLLFVTQEYSFAILRPLQEAIRQRGDRAAWFIASPGLFHHLRDEEIHLKQPDEVVEFNPRAVFVPGNWVPHTFPGVKVEVFHGFGIEKKGHFKIRGFFDLYCTHGPATTEPFNQLQNKYRFFRVTETGWPKIDPLLKNRKAIRSHQKTILYAPTFSPSLTSTRDLLPAIRSLRDSKPWKWIIKFHPKMDHQIIQAYCELENENLHVSQQSDITELMRQADVMVSDTSSVVAEFLVLDKPVITYRNRDPGEHTHNIDATEKLGDAVEQAFDQPNKLLSGSRKFIAQMHPWNDGNSSQRVLDATEDFISTGRQGLRRKPLNLWRKFQVNKRLRKYQRAIS